VHVIFALHRLSLQTEWMNALSFLVKLSQVPKNNVFKFILPKHLQGR